MGRSEKLGVSVIVERYGVSHRWQSGDAWRVVEVLAGRPAEVRPWTCLSAEAGCRRYFAGDLELELFRSETEGYLRNLTSARPSVYVIIRHDRAAEHGIALHAATVDAGEVEAHADAGDDIIDSVPMPATVTAWVADFVVRHHVERPFHKRRRDRLDPEALGRGRPLMRPQWDESLG